MIFLQILDKLRLHQDSGTSWVWGTQCLSGRVLDLGSNSRRRWFETHRRRWFVSKSKTLYPLLRTGLTKEDREKARPTRLKHCWLGRKTLKKYWLHLTGLVQFTHIACTTRLKRCFSDYRHLSITTCRCHRYLLVDRDKRSWVANNIEKVISIHNIYRGYLKEPSLWDGSFMYTQCIFW